jgi:hypothetical protein
MAKGRTVKSMGLAASATAAAGRTAGIAPAGLKCLSRKLGTFEITCSVLNFSIPLHYSQKSGAHSPGKTTTIIIDNPSEQFCQDVLL